MRMSDEASSSSWTQALADWIATDYYSTTEGRQRTLAGQAGIAIGRHKYLARRNNYQILAYTPYLKIDLCCVSYSDYVYGLGAGADLARNFSA